MKDFKVLMLLGKGSFACVYRAKSVKTGLEVAIKTVRLLHSPLWLPAHANHVWTVEMGLGLLDLSSQGCYSPFSLLLLGTA